MRIFFGGKGGVGKTTISAVFALLCARSRPTLIVSTDPAHSLSDLFGVKIGGKTRPIPLPENFRGALSALELDPERALKQYEESLLRRVQRLNLHLDFDVRAYIRKLAATPGSQEMALFDAFADLLLAEEERHIVFDTAPTAATFNLLQTAALIDQWIAILLKARKGILKLKEYYGQPAADDQMIRELQAMKQRFEKVERLLKAGDTHFVLVLNPEKLPVEETRRSLQFFRANHLPLRGLVVNRIWPSDESLPAALRGYQSKYLDIIRGEWKELLLAEVPWWTREPQGLPNLLPLTEFLAQTPLAALLTEEPG